MISCLFSCWLFSCFQNKFTGSLTSRRQTWLITILKNYDKFITFALLIPYNVTIIIGVMSSLHRLDRRTNITGSILEKYHLLKNAIKFSLLEYLCGNMPDHHFYQTKNVVSWNLKLKIIILFDAFLWTLLITYLSGRYLTRPPTLNNCCDSLRCSRVGAAGWYLATRNCRSQQGEHQGTIGPGEERSQDCGVWATLNIFYCGYDQELMQHDLPRVGAAQGELLQPGCLSQPGEHQGTIGPGEGASLARLETRVSEIKTVYTKIILKDFL